MCQSLVNMVSLRCSRQACSWINRDGFNCRLYLFCPLIAALRVGGPASDLATLLAHHRASSLRIHANRQVTTAEVSSGSHDFPLLRGAKATHGTATIIASGFQCVGRVCLRGSAHRWACRSPLTWQRSACVLLRSCRFNKQETKQSVSSCSTHRYLTRRMAGNMCAASVCVRTPSRNASLSETHMSLGMCPSLAMSPMPLSPDLLMLVMWCCW